MKVNQALKKADELQKTYAKMQNLSDKNTDLYSELTQYIGEMKKLGREDELEGVGLTKQFLASNYYDYKW